MSQPELDTWAQLTEHQLAGRGLADLPDPTEYPTGQRPDWIYGPDLDLLTRNEGGPT